MTVPRDRDAGLDELDTDALTSPDFTADDAAEMSDDERKTSAIRDDIEETRTEMGETLGELGERLDPARVMEQAKENVREATIGRVEHAVEDVGETARGTTDMVMNTIKENPIPAALAGAGLFMLWRNRSQSSGNGHRMQSRQGFYDQRYYGDASSGSMGGAVGGAAGNVAASVADTAGIVVSSVGGAASNVAGSAGQLAGDAVQQGQQTAVQLGSQLERFMQRSPLAMGAIAYGVGAVVGALVPETDQERELLAKPAEQVSSTVRDTVNQAMDKVEERADEAERELSRT